MKKILYSILISVVVLGFVSCDDFLERDPITEIDPSNYFRSEAEIRSVALNMYTYMDGLDLLQREHFTDNCFGGKNSDAISYTHSTHNPSTPIFQSTWDNNYKGVGQSNLVINADMSEDVDESVRNSYLADAYFMRAYYYSDLLFLFGGVPILTDSPSLTGNLYPERSTKDQVLELIMSDLATAIEYLPVDPEKGRASLGAAYMLKARVHIFFNEFEAASEAAKAVIDLGEYSLYNDFRELFYAETEDSNNEVIFSIQYLEDLYPNDFYQKIANSSKRYNMSMSLHEEFEMNNGLGIYEDGSGYDDDAPYANRDPRYNVSIFLGGDSRSEDGISDPEPFLGKTPKSKTGMIGDKYKKWGEDDELYTGSDWIIMRYSDLLLLFAEATNEVSGATQDVYDAVNSVRARVEMPELPTGLTQDEMREKIRKERRIELVNEGQRLFDILRWEIGEEAMIPLDGFDPKKLKELDDLSYKVKTIDEDRTFDAEKGYLWPIPQTEMDLNINLVQNPGY